jgi:RHS repeat-associated protein
VSTAAGDVVDARTYNGFGELETYEATYAGTPLYAASYTRDARGRIVGMVETIEGETHAVVYGYDEAGRLVTVARDGATIATYGYDANGNRLTRTTPGGTTISAHDAQDRLVSQGATTFAYGASGALALRTAPSGTTVYDYDALGQLRGVGLPSGSTLEYVVDPLQRRVVDLVDGSIARAFLHLGAGRIVAELDAAGAVRQRYVHATHASTPDLVREDQVTYRLIADHLGSPRLVVDAATGTVAQRMDFDEFGRVTLDTAPGFQPFGWAGGLYDHRTGLVRFGRRDYDANVGRFIAKDPIGFAGGSGNLYEYAVNDPVNYTDPSGLTVWRCQRPIQGLFDDDPSRGNRRNGPDIPGNMLFHEYLCVELNGQMDCGGLGPQSPGLSGPGIIEPDEYRPENCEEEEDEGIEDCVEQCVMNKFDAPAPRYNVPGDPHFGEHCQQFADNTLDDCRDRCDPTPSFWEKLFDPRQIPGLYPR